MAAVTIILITAQCTSSATPTSAPLPPANTQPVNNQPVATDTLNSVPSTLADTQPAATDTSISIPTAPADTQPAATTMDGLALLQDRCVACHSLQRAVSGGGNAARWKSVVDNMFQQGAQLSVAEETVLVNYLAQTYP